MPKRSITHLSYSTLDSWQQCGKKVQLSKIMEAPRTPAWWFAGGSAVHKVTEEWDLLALAENTLPAWDDKALRAAWKVAFEAEIAEIESTEPDRSKWRASKEGYAEWNEVGPELVKAWTAWRLRSPWQIWITPDGEPAIELDVSDVLPDAGLPIKMFIDRVFHDPILNQLHVVDLKTGTRKPESPLQFGVYAAGLQAKYGVMPSLGMAFMNRRGAVVDPWPLAKFTPPYISGQFAQLAKAVKSEIFIPKVQSLCRFCDVSDACYANNGPLAERYDPDHPDWNPPF